MDSKELIKKLIKNVLENLLIEEVVNFVVEHPANLKMGDYSTNVAMVAYAAQQDFNKKDLNLQKRKQVQISAHHQGYEWNNPKELAGAILAEIEKNLPKEIKKVEIAGPGFINFYLSREFYNKNIKEVLKQKSKFGQNTSLGDQKFFIEHTQPNPFKEFHIGHLMNNAIGESIVRIERANGAEVKAASYHGDVGMHIAKAIWGLQNFVAEVDKHLRSKWKKVFSYIQILITLSSLNEEKLKDNLKFAYTYGSQHYELDENIKGKIQEINKKIYDHSDKEINKLYKWGRKVSFNEFEKIYKRLGSKFDYHFYESETGNLGKKIILRNLGKIFKEGEKGAVIFEGENFEPKTHTRVFLNSEGLPTYEAKEVGLAKIKKDLYPYTKSITVTADEQDAFFDVVEVAIGEVFPDVKGRLQHLSHGLLKLPSGKMSSRTGTIISAESLISQVKEKVFDKIKERDFSAQEKESLAEMIAIGAIKYSILHQAIGGDVIFDFDKSISFEGDSGPYLQYSYARAKSILEKAGTSPLAPLLKGEGDSSFSFQEKAGDEVYEIEKLLYRFPEVVLRAGSEYAPHYIASYLIEIARSFNSFYANTQIINKEDPSSGYKIALTEAFSIVMKNGLYLLGIQTPEKM